MGKRIASAIAGVALFAAASGGFAEELRGVYLGPSVTGYFFDDDRFIHDEDDDAVVLGLNLGYRFDNPLAIELGYGRDIDGMDLDVFRLDGFYYLPRSEGGWAPYFVLGYTNYNFDDKHIMADGDDSTGQMDAGFGVSKTWGTQWEFRGDGRFLERFGSGDQATDLALNLALNYYFAKPAAPVAEPEPVAQPQPAPETRTLTVKLNVLFEFDKSVVRAIYGDELAAVGSAMREHDDIELVLEGHTDSVGSDAYNQDLSKRRVEAVKEKLVADFGIAANRINTVGYGESRPIADNATEEGRALNRRVVGELTFTEVVTP